MADTHHHMNRGGYGVEKETHSHPARRHPVPIRPAFRPLLPKPCTPDSSQPMPIHIHTRASLANRKRAPNGKSDLQKRRRSAVTAGATGKAPRAGSPGTAATTVSASSHGGSASSPNSLDGRVSSDTKPGLAGGLGRNPTLPASISTASVGAQGSSYLSSPVSNGSLPTSPEESSRSSSVHSFHNDSSFSGAGGISSKEKAGLIQSDQDLLNSVNTATIFGPIDGSVDPMNLSSTAPNSPKNLAADLSGSVDNSYESYLGFAEDPSALRNSSISSVTIDPLSIEIEGQSIYDLGGGNTLSTGTFSSQNDAVDMMTPPETIKGESLASFAANTDYDDFSDIYFRNFQTEDTKRYTSSFTENVSEDINPDSNDAEYSMLDFLTPSLDLF